MKRDTDETLSNSARRNTNEQQRGGRNCDEILTRIPTTDDDTSSVLRLYEAVMKSNEAGSDSN